jgi:hypothetical protein
VRTIAVMNEKGGSGKTTTTISLAAVLAERGFRILVVDLVPQASASLWLGRGREPGLYRAIADKRDLEPFVRAARGPLVSTSLILRKRSATLLPRLRVASICTRCRPAQTVWLLSSTKCCLRILRTSTPKRHSAPHFYRCGCTEKDTCGRSLDPWKRKWN